MLEYAPRGLIGALTPQANTTVEPELAILLPPGFAFVNARLTSPKASMEERLVDYLERLHDGVAQFANAPIDAFAFACTGASYLAGIDREDALVARIESERGVPFVTAAKACCAALGALGARRIGLVSPYPPALTEKSIAYWGARGFTVTETASAFNAESGFHPIYSLGAASAADALGRLRGASLDAVLMLGTGMPTLGPIAAQAGNGPPTLSCMTALAWRAVEAANRGPADAASLLPWTWAEGWGERLRAQRPA